MTQRPNHLTRSDRRFLAGVSREPVHQLDDIAELVDDVCAAADAAGIVPDLNVIRDLDDEVTVNDPDRLAEIRARLRSQLGKIERGEQPSYDARAEENRALMRELREFREELAADTEAMNDPDGYDEEPIDDEPAE